MLRLIRYLLPLSAAISFIVCSQPVPNNVSVATSNADLKDSIGLLLTHFVALDSIGKQNAVNLSGLLKRISSKKIKLDTTSLQQLDQIGKALILEDLNVQARNCYEQILEQQPEMPMDHLLRIRCYHNIGYLYEREGNLSNGLLYFEKANQRTTTNYPSPFVATQIELGYCYSAVNEYQAALRCFEKAYQVYQDMANEKFIWRKLELLQLYSDCYRKARLYQKSIQLAQEGLIFMKEQPDMYDANLVANLQLNIGNAWNDSLKILLFANGEERKKIGLKSIEAISTALRLYQSLQADWTLISNASNSLAESYHSAGDHSKAIAIFNQAIQTRRAQISTIEGDPQMQLFFLNRAETQSDMGAYQAALADYDTSLYLFVPAYRFGQSELPELRDLSIRTSTYLQVLLQGRANTWLALGKTGQITTEQATAGAMQSYKALVQLTNYLRDALVSDEAKIALAGESQQNLRHFFDLAIQLGDYKQAFELAEQSKAVLLLDQLHRRNMRTSLDTAAIRVLESQQKIDARLDSINRQMFLQRNNASALSGLQEEWRRTFGQKATLSQQSTKNIGGGVVAIQTIQSQMLAPDQALVEYFTRDTLIHIFVVRKDTFFHYSQSISADFDRVIADLDWNASAGKKDIAREQVLCKTAYRLYQTLLEPVAHLLPERLIIIPDANLQSLPFETLLTDAPTEGAGIAAQGQQQRFVLFKYVVSYCYSASLLYEMQRIDVAKGKKRRLVGFAPDFPATLHASSGLPQSIIDVLPVLRHLPNEEELEAINEKICMDRFVDSTATKGCFFNTCRDALAVHVATHGILVDDAPANNFIAFNQAQDTVNTSEFLYLSELASQEPLNLELATFSACETARGKYVAGEGNMSMARALAAAGVKSILTTLWPVRTTQQARLMPVFYDQFTANGGADKDRALTLAKRDFILNSDAYPAAWAGTILIGASNRFELPSNCQETGFHIWYWVLGSGLCLGLLGILYWFGKKKRAEGAGT